MCIVVLPISASAVFSLLPFRVFLDVQFVFLGRPAFSFWIHFIELHSIKLCFSFRKIVGLGTDTFDLWEIHLAQMKGVRVCAFWNRGSPV